MNGQGVMVSDHAYSAESSATEASTALFGRRNECQELDRLLNGRVPVTAERL